MTATAEVQSGLEGVVAFATEIAEPDRAGGALRYRGVDIEELVGNVPFEQVWGLLVDGKLLPGMPPAEPHPLHVHSGDPRVDVQAALAMLAPQWGFGQLIDITDEHAGDDLARAAVMALCVVAQSASDTQCASSACVSGTCAECKTDANCGGGNTCAYVKGFEEAGALPHLSPPDVYVSRPENSPNATTQTARGAVTATVRDARDVVDGQGGAGPVDSRQVRERTGAGTFLTGNASAFRPAWEKLEGAGGARCAGEGQPQGTVPRALPCSTICIRFPVSKPRAASSSPGR